MNTYQQENCNKNFIIFYGHKVDFRNIFNNHTIKHKNKRLSNCKYITEKSEKNYNMQAYCFF
jgi:hypothetical protein